MSQKMQLKEGDMVRFDYTLYLDDHKDPVDTSVEELAKEHGIHREDKHYRPLTIALGHRQIIPGLEKHMLEHGEAGKTIDATFGPDDAYGPRDPQKLKDIPMAEFRKQKIKPEIGMVLNVQDGQGTVVRVAGGRVRVDMNHDLAGKSLRYEYTIRDVISDDDEKIKASLDNAFPMGGFDVEVTDEWITLELPDQAKFDQNWGQHKFQLLTQLRMLGGTERGIKLVETYPADLGREAGGEEE